jgi:hypothetical protein
MDKAILGILTQSQVVFFGLTILIVFLLLFLVFFLTWKITQQPPSLSPYTGMPLRRATCLSYYSIERILRYLYSLHQYDNKVFDIKKAALCRDTGRIFPDCVTWYDVIKVDWTFIQKRHKGNYVSWGSLSDIQKKSIETRHDTLQGFQTAYSSSNPSPRLVEDMYAFEKPGPLYVDIETGVLIGWQCVPDTDLEVLIVQKPTVIITPTLPKE